jgi:copper transport protein
MPTIAAPRTPARASWVLARLLAVLAVAVVGLVGLAAPASAHNSFVSSEPSDGSVLDAVPPSVLLRFAKDVPLDTVQVLWIDQSGSRVDLTPLTHGPGGQTEVVAPVPPGAQGPVTIRWRLVGSDGHVVSGRVGLTLPAVTATTAATGGAAPVATSPAAPAASVAPPAVDDDASAAPSGGFRWVLRLASFVSMVLLGGVVIVAGFLWPGAWLHRPVRVVGVVAGIVLVTSSFGLLLVLAADLDGGGLLAAVGAIDAATATEAGTALAVRVALAAVTLGVLVAWHPADDRTRWMVLGGLVLVGLGTWAVNGHARSMRWSWLGVPLDVVHYAAAAAWLGGLVVLAGVAFRHASTDDLVVAVRRFSGLAAVAVTVIVATGVVQAVRLVGGVAAW